MPWRTRRSPLAVPGRNLCTRYATETRTHTHARQRSHTHARLVHTCALSRILAHETCTFPLFALLSVASGLYLITNYAPATLFHHTRYRCPHMPHFHIPTRPLVAHAAHAAHVRTHVCDISSCHSFIYTNCPSCRRWYHGVLSRTDAEIKLKGTPDGTYLIRDSSSSVGDFVLSAR